MIRAHRVSVLRRVPGSAGARVLSDVDLELGAGEFLAVLGRPGAGKTTLLEAVAGLLPLHGGRVELRLRRGLHSWRAGDDSPRGLGARIGLLFQFPERQLFGSTALEDVSWGLGEAGESEGHEALLRSGIPTDRHELPLSRLSRGEKRRVALAGVLARGPDALLLDEPTVGLDAAGRELLWAEVERFRREKHAAVIVATHWAEHVLPLADAVLCLEEGRALFRGSRVGFLRAAQTDGTLRALLPFAERLRARLLEGPSGAPPGNTWQTVALRCLERGQQGSP